MQKIVKKEIDVEDPNEMSTGLLVVSIKSTAPLLYNRMDEMTILAILEKREGKADPNAAQMPRDRFREAFLSVHFLGDARPTSWEEVQAGKAYNPLAKKQEPIRYGFPASGFLGGLVRAAKSHNVNMTDARVMFKIVPDWKNMVHIKTTEIPAVRIDHVGNGAVAARASLSEWEAVLRIEFNCRLVSAEQLLSWLRMAGSMIGIGAFRISGKNSCGENGSFSLSGTASVVQPDVPMIVKKKGKTA